MRDWPHLPNAPIKEAILDIQATLPATIGLKQLEQMHDAIRDGYPKKKARKRVEGSLDLDSGEFRPSPAKVDGYLFLSEDERQIVQARLDGFTVNKLKPYATWEALVAEAKTMWSRYVDAAHPEVIKRISLRYVNRLELPFPITDLKQYVGTCPDIAPGIPQAVSGFFMRLQIPYPNLEGVVVIITETVEPVEAAPSGEVLPFIFDIDVLRHGPLSPTEVALLWDRFTELRDVKNEIFFNTITPSSEALFR
jgi:uncharacterized protein (TIGR04255 family)